MAENTIGERPRHEYRRIAVVAVILSGAAAVCLLLTAQPPQMRAKLAMPTVQEALSRVSAVLKPTLAKATKEKTDELQVEHTLADKEALMSKLREQADALETKIKKSSRQVAEDQLSRQPAATSTALTEEGLEVKEETHKILARFRAEQLNQEALTSVHAKETPERDDGVWPSLLRDLYSGNASRIPLTGLSVRKPDAFAKAGAKAKVNDQTSLAGEDSTAKSGASDDVLKSREDMDNGVDPEVPAAAAKRLAQSMEQTETKGETAVDDKAEEEAKKKAEEYAKKVIKERQDWSKANPTDDVKKSGDTRALPSFARLFRTLPQVHVNAVYKDSEDVNALYKVFKQKLHEQDQALRALMGTRLPTLPPTHPPADATSTAHPQEAMMFKAGAKAKVNDQTSLAGEDSTANSGASDDVLKSREDMDNGVDPEVPAAAAKRLAQSMEQTETKGETAVDDKAEEEAKKKAEEYAKKVIKERQDWSKANPTDDAMVAELKKALWRAEAKADAPQADAQTVVAVSQSEPKGKADGDKANEEATASEPPADTTFTAHPQEALIFKAGVKAPVKANMDTFELQAKRAADQVKTLWGFKSEGILDDSQYQKAKAQVMAELNNEASHEGKPLLTGIGRDQILASKEVKAATPFSKLQKASKVQEETQAAADGTGSTAQLVHEAAVNSDSGAVEARVTVVPHAVMPVKRVSVVLKPTLAMAMPRTPNSETAAEIEHTLADKEALMSKLREQADALETKIKKSLRYAPATVGVANEAASALAAAKDVYQYLKQEKKLEVKIKGAERSVETLGVKLVTAVNHGPQPQTHAQAVKPEEDVTAASLSRQRKKARYRVLAQQTSLMATPHVGGDKYLPRYLERENRENINFLRRGKDFQTQMEAEEGEESKRQEIPETYEFRIGEGGGMRAEHGEAPHSRTYDVVRSALVNSGPLKEAKREQPPFIGKYESDVMKKLMSDLAEKPNVTDLDPSISLPPSATATESKGDEKEALLKQIEVRRDEEARKIEEESRKEATLALQIKYLTQAQQSMATNTKLRVKVETEDDRQEAQIWKKLSKRFEEEAQTRIAAEAVAEKAAENKAQEAAKKEAAAEELQTHLAALDKIVQQLQHRQ